MPATVISMLLGTRLKFLEGDLHIFKILEKHDTSMAARQSLLHVAAETIALILQTGNARDRAAFLAQDFVDVVSSVSGS